MNRRYCALFSASLLAIAGCGETADDRGSLMLAISTDMYVDKDVSRVDIVVQPERGPLQSTQVNLFPELEGQFLPGTFSIIEGSEPGEFVRVRIIARQDSRVRVVRESALRVPRQRTALLSMPIQWLCDGQVRADGQLHHSDCEEGQTCISGACQPDAVDEAALPDYVIEDVFGGGDATGGGECFDTLPCFEDSWQPELDLPSCRLNTPLAGDLNVAVVLPSGGDGHCTSTECWIPLDQSELSGWAAVDGGQAIALPAAVCSHVSAGAASVRASTRCAPKSPGTPTCGQWSLVGSDPGGDGELPPNDVAIIATDARLIDNLESASQTLAREIAVACASLAEVSPPATFSGADVDTSCDLAVQSLAGQLPLTWYHTPTTCRIDYEIEAACERECDATCDPLPVEQRCESNRLSGDCDGVCGSRVCLSRGAQAVECQGACNGEFSGTCQGNCLGVCDGTCSTPSPNGYCDGICEGICSGLCQGRGDGACVGRCDGDPNLAAAACAEGARCMGGCEGSYTDAACDGGLATSGCQPGCEGICSAIGRVNSECDSASAWVLVNPTLTAVRAATIAQSLPALVRARDMRASYLLDEASRLAERLTETTYTTQEQRARLAETITLLSAIQASLTDVLTSTGPARGGMGPITVPPGPGPGTCEGATASGSAPLIDDFEDSNAIVLPNDGRDGGWYVITDGTGVLDTLNPLITLGGAGDSGHSLFVSGSGFTEWGAGASLDLRQNSLRYDASAHQGLRFWARGIGALRVIFPQANLTNSHPCATCPAASLDCGIYYKADIPLTDAWTEHSIAWTVLGRDYQGGTPFNPAELLNVKFEAPGPNPFEIQLDDVSFY